MATVQLGVIPPLPRDDTREGEVIRVDTEIEAPDVEIVSVEAVKEEAARIEDAKVIIAAGRGVKDFALLQELAKVLEGTIGGTLPLVDAGLLAESHLIGQTGKTVKPKLYIGCGISGAGQHIVGMQNSEVIVAINKDETAPVFKVADYGIVGDLHKIVPALVASLSDLSRT
jgi:electron transfer flavoprotein alpha subunit